MGNTASFMGGMFSVPDLAANVQDWATMKYQGDQQRQAAEDANRFTESMSNTSWQRGVADMRKAGINPMLAFSQGGASSPTMQAAQVPDYSRMTGGSASSFGFSPLVRAQVRGQEASNRLTDANTLETLARTPNHASTRQLQAEQRRNLHAATNRQVIDSLNDKVNLDRNREMLQAEQRRGPFFRGLQAVGSLAHPFQQGTSSAMSLMGE